MICVYSSKIVIKNYKEGDYETLQKRLSVWDPVTFSVSIKAYIIDGEDMIIPIGFNVKQLYFLYPEKVIRNFSDADRQKPVIFKSNYEPKDDNQRQAIDFLLSEESNNKMLCLKTGAGKTFCTIYSLSKIKKRAMIIVDTDKALKQWRDEFVKFTTLHENDIYFIAGSDSIEKILAAKKDLNYRVFIASHRTIHSFANKNGWDKVGELFSLLQIGVKVYDEAHVEFKNIFMIDCHTHTKETFYLTATPGRSNVNEDRLYQSIFKNIPKYGLEAKFHNNYHHIYYITYDSKPTLKDQQECQSKRGFDINKFFAYSFDNEEKFKAVFEVINTFISLCMKRNEGKLAIIIHKIDHVDRFYDIITKLYPDKTVGRFYSKIPVKEREKELDKDIIISTDKSLGKAVDIANLQYVIMTVPTSSKIVSEQVLGRLREIPGKKVVYFDLTDRGFSACKKQLQNRRKLLDKKAVSIKKLDL